MLTKGLKVVVYLLKILVQLIPSLGLLSRPMTQDPLTKESCEEGDDEIEVGGVHLCTLPCLLP